MPPLVVVPLPEEEETPDEDDSPEEDEVPDDDDVPDEDEEVSDDVPDDLLAEDVPADLLDDDVPELLDATCVAVVEVWAKVAPMPAAAAADSRPTCQVIFLTRRRPRSLDWRAAATSVAGATGLDLVTGTELPVIFCCRAEKLLKQLSVSRRRRGTGSAPSRRRKNETVSLGIVKKIASFRPHAESGLPYRGELSTGFRARGGR